MINFKGETERVYVYPVESNTNQFAYRTKLSGLGRSKDTEPEKAEWYVLAIHFNLLFRQLWIT
jgi:hypothetical protein